MTKLKPIKSTYLAAVAAVLSVPFSNMSTHAEPLTDEQVQKLIQRVDELEQEVKVLKRNEEVDKEVATDKSKDMPTVSLGLGGLTVRSADSNFVMIAHGYAQLDGRNYFGQKTASDTMLLRRVRPIVEGTVWQDFNYRLMLDLGANTVSSSTANNVNILDDAYVNARFWKQAQIQIGKYKSPVGLERLQSTADLFFIETGFATQLTPNYDLGVMIHNDYFNTPIGYALGIFDGAVDGGSEDADIDEGKDIAGRLFLQPFLDTDFDAVRSLGFGVGGSIGSHTGATLGSYKTPGQQNLFTYSANVIPSGIQYRIDPQAYYFFGPFGLMGEYILSSQNFKTTGTGVPPEQRFNNRAWQVEATYFLTGEENSFKSSSYKHVVPRHNFKLGEDGWGALELVARVEQLDLDQNSFTRFGAVAFEAPGSAQRATGWAVGVNWYLNANVKLNLNYESTTFSGITPPATAGTPSATARPEHVLLSQVQFQF